MPDHPIDSLSAIASLDAAEVVEGYRDGRAGEPEPGGNRSLSYVHGWRNGAADVGRIPIDDAMRRLAYEYVRGPYA